MWLCVGLFTLFVVCLIVECSRRQRRGNKKKHSYSCRSAWLDMDQIVCPTTLLLKQEEVELLLLLLLFIVVSDYRGMKISSTKDWAGCILVFFPFL